LGKHVAAGAAFISNFALWNESGYFDASARSKPLLHLWSMGIEEQFYLFWPLLLWFAYRRSKNFLALTCLVALASCVINLLTVIREPVAAFYSPLSRFWELMIGSILAYLALHRPQNLQQYSGLRSLVGFLLIVTALLVLSDHSTFPGWWALLPTIGAFLVLSATPTAWFNRRVLSNRLLVWVGLISYPLYLWHWPLLYLLYLSDPASRLWRLAVVAFSILLVALTYLLIEKPIRRAKGARDSAPYLIAAVTLCGFIGLSCYLSDGFGFRLPEQI
jgi:peptidoglycan/LPS O-acetylase OafA/YrhL